MADRLARLFMGSTREGLPAAEALTELLAECAEIQIWNSEFFVPGEYALETLETHLSSFDGAIIVGTADDSVTSRGETFDAMRDNLLLEFGMFVAAFGRRRALLALEGLGSTKIPSDAFGLTCVGFEKTDPVADGLRQAANELKRAIGTFSLDVVEPQMVSRLERVLRAFLGELQSALGAANVGFHVWVVDEAAKPPRLVRVARSRTVPRAQLDMRLGKGEGIAGECWQTARPVAVNFSEEPYASVSESAWKTFGPGVQRGMSFNLLEESRKRYKVVGTTSLISDSPSGNKFVGCLSYNVGPNADSVAYQPDALAVETVLDRAAEVVRVLLETR